MEPFKPFFDPFSNITVDAVDEPAGDPRLENFIKPNTRLIKIADVFKILVVITIRKYEPPISSMDISRRSVKGRQ